MSILNYQDIPNNSANPQYIAVKKVLDRAGAYVALDIACDKEPINRQMGRSVNFKRWNNPAVDLTVSAVSEGVTPTARALSSTDYTGTLVRYAELFEVSRYNYDLNPYDAVKGSADVGADLVLSDQERVRYNAGISGTNVLYNSAAISSRATVNGTITLGRFQVAIRSIRGSKGMAFNSAEGGQNKEGTSPVEAAYYAFTSSDMEPDLRALPGFKTVAEYPTGKGLPYEFGAVQNIRIFTNPEYVPFANGGAASTTLKSTNTTGTTSGAADVYPIIVMAKHALTSVPLAGSGAKGFGNAKANILDQPDKSDPTNERVYVAFSWYDLCMVTAQEWLYRIEVGVTRNPS